MRNFMAENGYDARNIFFVTNRAAMEAAWRHYVKKWAKYSRVVWQLGLRGISNFFHSFGEIGDGEYKNYCKFNNFNYYEYRGLSFPVYALSDEFLCWYIRRPFEDNVKFFNPLMENVFKQGIENMKKAAKRFHKVYKTLCSRQAKQRDVFARQWLYQSLYWTELLYAGREIFIALKRVKFGKKLNRAAHYRRASKHIAKILQARDIYYVGEWKNGSSSIKSWTFPRCMLFYAKKEKSCKKRNCFKRKRGIDVKGRYTFQKVEHFLEGIFL